MATYVHGYGPSPSYNPHVTHIIPSSGSSFFMALHFEIHLDILYLQVVLIWPGFAPVVHTFFMVSYVMIWFFFLSNLCVSAYYGDTFCIK